MNQNKYVIQYAKIIEAKSNSIDVLNFMSNIQNTSFQKLNLPSDELLKMEKQNQNMLDAIEGVSASLIILLQLTEKIEKSCEKLKDGK